VYALDAKGVSASDLAARFAQANAGAPGAVATLRLLQKETGDLPAPEPVAAPKGPRGVLDLRSILRKRHMSAGQLFAQMDDDRSHRPCLCHPRFTR
jgi:hypothetical protein